MRRETRFFACAHLKGGTGGSTTTVHLGAALALAGQSVRILDLDTIGSAIFMLADVENIGPSIAEELAAGTHPGPDLFLPTAVPKLTVAPGGLWIHEWEGRASALRDRMRSFLDSLAGGSDYVLIDCPGGRGAMIQAVLRVMPGGRVLAPVTTSTADLVGFSALLQLLEETQEINPDLRLAGIIPCRVRRTRNAQEILAALTGVHGRKVLPGIRESTVVAQAALRHTPVQVFAPRHPVVEDFEALARAVRRLR